MASFKEELDKAVSGIKESFGIASDSARMLDSMLVSINRQMMENLKATKESNRQLAGGKSGSIEKLVRGTVTGRLGAKQDAISRLEKIFSTHPPAVINRYLKTLEARYKGDAKIIQASSRLTRSVETTGVSKKMIGGYKEWGDRLKSVFKSTGIEGGGSKMAIAQAMQGGWGGNFEAMNQEMEKNAAISAALGLSKEQEKILVDKTNSKFARASQIMEKFIKAGKNAGEAIEAAEEDKAKIIAGATSGARELQRKNIPGMGWLAKKEDLASRGIQPLGIGARFASIGLGKLNSALLTNVARLGVAEIAWMAISKAIDVFNALRAREAKMVPILMGGMNQRVHSEQAMYSTLNALYRKNAMEMYAAGEAGRETFNNAIQAMGQLGANIPSADLQDVTKEFISMQKMGASLGWEFAKSTTLGKSLFRAFGKSGMTGQFDMLIRAAQYAGMSIDELEPVLGDLGKTAEEMGADYAKSRMAQIAAAAGGGSSERTMAQRRFAATGVAAIGGGNRQFLEGMILSKLGKEGLKSYQSGEAGAGVKAFQGILTDQLARMGTSLSQAAAPEADPMVRKTITELVGALTNEQVAIGLSTRSNRDWLDVMTNLSKDITDVDFKKATEGLGMSVEERGQKVLENQTGLMDQMVNFLKTIADNTAEAIGTKIRYPSQASNIYNELKTSFTEPIKK